ncbi:MAG TPA: hypothetical protein PKH33_09445 [bacterium]|nr:hypothetical protein [bacterium]
MNKSRMICAGLLCLILAAAGCGGGGGRGTLLPSQPGAPAANKLSRVIGYVYDGDGRPVSGVRAQSVTTARGVRVAAAGGGASAVSDANGMFYFSVSSSPAENERIVLKLSKGGYVDNHVVYRVRYSAVENEDLLMPVRMLRAPGSESPETATVAEVRRANGTTAIFTPTIVTDPDSGLPVARTVVTIEDDIQEVSFKLPSPANTNVSSVTFTIGGAVSAGRSAGRVLGSEGGSIQVTGSLFYGDPTDPKALEVFPGEFLTKDNVPSSAARRTAGSGGGGEGVLVTAGFTQIKLTDSSGDEITSFADGAEVGVVMRVPDGVFNPDTGATVAEGDNVPIFTYDEAAGEWKVEYNSNGTIKRGTVMRDTDGLYVPFTTDHLSWFNLDWKGLRCPDGHPAIKAVDDTGAYLTSFSVSTLHSDSAFWTYPMQTNDGIAEFMSAPADIPWSIRVWAEGFYSDTVSMIGCNDVTIPMHRLNGTRVYANATCGGRAYSDVNIYAYKENIRVGSQKALHGTASLLLPPNTEVTIYGISTDSCKDIKSDLLTTTNAYTAQSVQLLFDNACCPTNSYDEPLRVSGLTPAKAIGVNPEASVNGTIVFSKPVMYPIFFDMPLTITLKQGADTILDNVAASTLGTVSWPDASVGTAQTLSFTVARADDIQAGKTYSFTVGLAPSYIIADDGAELELSSYLSSTSGVVSYTAASVTGSFSTVSDGTNRLPEPVPGPDKDAGIGALVTLDGSESSDLDGDPLTFDWEQVSGPSVVISNSTSAVATFTPSTAGVYVFKLTVNDGNGGIVSAQTTATVCNIFCGTNADCDDSDPLTSDVCENPNTCSAECSNTTCSAECSSDSDCDDSDPNTVDECSAPGTCEAACVNCIPACENNSQCNDSDPLTFDTCENTNTCAASCVNTPIECNTDTDCYGGTPACINGGLLSSDCVVCVNNSHCDDSAPLTWDVCENQGQINAYCSNTPCEAACYSASDCNDGNPDTNDMCFAPASCEAECLSFSNLNVISAGYSHSCAIHTNGTVKCWGDNSYGQLGDGSTTNSLVPVTVTGISNAVSVDVGFYNHTCAVLSDGQVKCWGYNGHGILGDGTTTSSYMPVTVTGISNASSVSAGGNHTCAVLSDGQIKCWGNNSNGQFGDGTTTASSVPIAVTGISNASSVSAGDLYTCAVLSDGQIKCWGWNDFGQLGDGTTTDSLVPISVTGISNAVSVAVGNGYLPHYTHTCAVLSDGQVRCWGNGGYGQLGNGTTTDSSVPVAATGVSTAVSVDVGFYHTCAVLSDGQVKCWGYNMYGLLGNGTTISSKVPLYGTGIYNAISISVGGDHTCSALSDGLVKCWGNNSSGQLGNGTTTDSLVPVLVNPF